MTEHECTVYTDVRVDLRKRQSTVHTYFVVAIKCQVHSDHMILEELRQLLLQNKEPYIGVRRYAELL
jgi:hypothetical protein